jgi:hypothetical protein
VPRISSAESLISERETRNSKPQQVLEKKETDIIRFPVFVAGINACLIYEEVRLCLLWGSMLVSVLVAGILECLFPGSSREALMCSLPGSMLVSSTRRSASLRAASKSAHSMFSKHQLCCSFPPCLPPSPPPLPLPLPLLPLLLPLPRFNLPTPPCSCAHARTHAQFFEHAEHLFNACDLQGTGVVDQEVFFSVLRHMNQTPTDIEHETEVLR